MPYQLTHAGRIFYDQRGSGPPVVMLPAALHDHADFDAVAERLADRYTTIAVDWPGHGRSDPASGGRPADALGLAGVLSELTDRLDLPPAVLIGNSVGGFAAARLALDQPHRVAGLVLVNSGGFTRPTAVTRLGTRVLGSPRANRQLYPRLVPRYMKPRNDHDRAITEHVRALARTAEGARTSAALWRSFGTPGFDLRAEADRLGAPVLLVWGERDIILPPAGGRETHAAIPGSRLHMLPTGHVVFASDPDGFLDVARPFIAAAHQTVSR
jgi:pimeloyl-ACP methyl ester carboxylesterase